MLESKQEIMKVVSLEKSGRKSTSISGIMFWYYIYFDIMLFLIKSIDIFRSPEPKAQDELL